MISVPLTGFAGGSIPVHSIAADGRCRISDNVEAEEPNNLNRRPLSRSYRAASASSRRGIDEQLLLGVGRSVEGDDVAGLEAFLLHEPAPAFR